jgi:superfamily II DNA helicase RecQ
MALTRFLRELRCPIVMLTAILPPSMMETFC